MSKFYTTLLQIISIAGVNAFLRAIPHIIFNKTEVPDTIQYIGKVLPHTIMIILVIYCLKGTSLNISTNTAATLLSLTATVIIHLLKKDTLISVISGTVIYMCILHNVFHL